MAWALFFLWRFDSAVCYNAFSVPGLRASLHSRNALWKLLLLFFTPTRASSLLLCPPALVFSLSLVVFPFFASASTHKQQQDKNTQEEAARIHRESKVVLLRSRLSRSYGTAARREKKRKTQGNGSACVGYGVHFARGGMLVVRKEWARVGMLGADGKRHRRSGSAMRSGDVRRWRRGREV